MSFETCDYRRRTPSPRRRTPKGLGQDQQQPHIPRSKQGGKGDGKAVEAWQPPPTPWPSDVRATSSSQASPPSDDRYQELLACLKAAYHTSGQAPSSGVAEVIGKLEADGGRSLTKQLHASASQLGSAKQALCQLQKAKMTHQASRQSFILSTVAALEKGAEQYEKRLSEYNQKEAEAHEKVAAARKSIRSLNSLAASDEAQDKDKIESAPDDSDSDVELQQVVEQSEEDSCQQATKKLKMTLEALCAKLPDQTDDTPRRRGKQEHPA